MPNLLLIEDNPHMQRVYRERFAIDGYNVTTADTGEHALQSIALTRPDVIVLDIILPGMSGFDFLKQLRADPKLAEIPVFILTAKSNFEDAQLGLSLGAKQFFSKSVSALPRVVIEIRRGCGFKAVAPINFNPDLKPIDSLLFHNHLLCWPNSIITQAASFMERRIPDLMIFDTTHTSPVLFGVLQCLKTNPVTNKIPVIAIANSIQPVPGVDRVIPADRMEADLRSVAFEMLNLTEPPAAPKA